VNESSYAVATAVTAENVLRHAMSHDIPPPVLIAHAYSMVAFLIDRHGPGVLGDFSTGLADEPDWRAVLRTTYSRAPNEAAICSSAMVAFPSVPGSGRFSPSDWSMPWCS